MKTKNIRRLLDGILIAEIIIIGLSIVLWFLLPSLIGLVFESYNETQSGIIELLITIISYLILNFPKLLLIELFLVMILLIIFAIFNMVNAIKRKRFIWFVVILFINKISIIYYFKYYRKELKKND